MITVEIYNQTDQLIPDTLVELINRSAALTVAATPFQQKLDEGKLDALCQLTLADSDLIKDTNREFRQIDQVTDILSFPGMEMNEGHYDGEIPEYYLVNPFAETRCVLLGDLMLCMDKAYEQAEEYGHSAEQEVAFLISHGILHLLGYDHMEEEEEKRMRAIQAEVRAAMGYENVE